MGGVPIGGIEFNKLISEVEAVPLTDEPRGGGRPLNKTAVCEGCNLAMSRAATPSEWPSPRELLAGGAASAGLEGAFYGCKEYGGGQHRWKAMLSFSVFIVVPCGAELEPNKDAAKTHHLYYWNPYRGRWMTYSNVARSRDEVVAHTVKSVVSEYGPEGLAGVVRPGPCAGAGVAAAGGAVSTGRGKRSRCGSAGGSSPTSKKAKRAEGAPKEIGVDVSEMLNPVFMSPQRAPSEGLSVSEHSAASVDGLDSLDILVQLAEGVEWDTSASEDESQSPDAAIFGSEGSFEIENTFGVDGDFLMWSDAGEVPVPGAALEAYEHEYSAAWEGGAGLAAALLY